MPQVHNLSDQKQFRKDLRNNLAPAEAILWIQLQGRKFHGLKFRRQHGVGPYVVDFYCPEIHLAVEVDGMSHFTPEEQERDRVRTEFIASKGICIVRVMNGDVYVDMEKVLTRIERMIPAVCVADHPQPLLAEGGETCFL